ncbi:O-antigen ligase family protein [Parapedobacter defluvii]|nr:O-antigen ligase family protein [Parapedobacter defluvii]
MNKQRLKLVMSILTQFLSGSGLQLIVLYLFCVDSFAFTMQILINKPEQISILIHAILLTGSVYVGSRALIVGFTVSLVLLFLYSRFRAKLGLQKVFYGISIFIPCLLLALIFLFKTDSSAGRMLVYKISSVIFSDNYAFGVGEGRFKSTFLQYQADYFEKGKFTEKELLLADNTYFAFNDYWQFMVEKGLVGIAVFLSISAVVIRLVIFLFKKYGRNMPDYWYFPLQPWSR